MLIIFEMILSLLSKRPNQCAFNDSDAVNVEIRFSPTRNTIRLICADCRQGREYIRDLVQCSRSRIHIVPVQVRGFAPYLWDFRVAFQEHHFL